MSTQQRLAVIGTGYVGLTTGACFASLGHDVTCIDTDEAKVRALTRGQVPIHERGLEALVHAGLEKQTLRFGTDAVEAIGDRDVVLLCLPTPTGSDGGADLSAVLAVTEQIREALPAGSVVVTKSTVPVGAGGVIERNLDRRDVAVASNPEFLREGTAVADFLGPDRVVLGANDPAVTERLADLYRGVDAPVLRMDRESAELVKYASNAFLAVKLSFVNDLAALCERLDGDIDRVTEGLGSDGRIGDRFLTPGPGWGGSCFPKDTRALAHMARKADLGFPLLAAAMEANEATITRVADRVQHLLGGQLEERAIGVLGLTFKAETDDLRDSPALGVVEALRERGAHVHAYDPMVDLRADVGAELHGDPYSACRNADAAVILTEWDEFSRLDLAKVADVMDGSTVLDMRAVIDRGAAERAGLQLSTVGRA